MKILVIDNLTQTFDGDIVRSGLQKSSKLDAQAFSQFHETTYAYCGYIKDDEHLYTHRVVSPKGAKDICLELGISPKRSYKFVKEFISKLKIEMFNADLIIAHCHSLSMINAVNEMVENKNIIFIVHDTIDLMWQSGFSNAVKNLRENKRNNAKIFTNSNYSIQRANFNHSRRKAFDTVMSGDELFDGYIRHFIWTKQRPEIKEKENFFSTIGRYTSDKFHHKLYDYYNPTHKIIHFGIKDPIRDEGLKYYEKMKLKANAYLEALPDDQLNEKLRTTKAVILPCPHEGFGFTAFEAGIYGAVPIVLVKEFSKTDIKLHATQEYLERSDTKHYAIDFNDEEALYKAINETINLSLEERKKISDSLLNYFTVENYVNERLSLCTSS